MHCCFFDSTKRFFEAWIAQLANYGLIAILTGAVAGLILSEVNNFAAQARANGPGIDFGQTADFLLLMVITFLVMRQVMPMAAGLASGIALSTGNLVGRAMQWGLGGVARGGRGMWDAFTGAGTTRWDPMSRKIGYRAAHPAAWAGKTLGKAIWRGGMGLVSGRNISRKK